MTKKKFSDHSEYNKRKGYNFSNLDKMVNLKLECKGIDLSAETSKSKKTYDTLYKSASSLDNPIKEVISALSEKNQAKNKTLTYSVGSSKRNSASL